MKRANPQERLAAGQVAAREGRYADALQEYVWFHDHALEHEPALYGVRLSFALGYWMELAASFPAAQQKLEEIRDRKTELLASGQGDRLLFHDVESINQALGTETETYRLFKRMLDSAPLQASACSDVALESIVSAGDFELAASQSDGPEEALLKYSDRLNEDLADSNRYQVHRAYVTDAYIHIYCHRVSTTVAILEGLGKSGEAGICREWAVALVNSKAVRKRLAEMLLEDKGIRLARSP